MFRTVAQTWRKQPPPLRGRTSRLGMQGEWCPRYLQKCRTAFLPPFLECVVPDSAARAERCLGSSAVEAAAANAPVRRVPRAAVSDHYTVTTALYLPLVRAPVRPRLRNVLAECAAATPPAPAHGIGTGTGPGPGAGAGAGAGTAPGPAPGPGRCTFFLKFSWSPRP
eukprot:gene23044-biopygen4284